MQYGHKNYNEIKTVGNCVLIEKIEEDDMRMSHGLYIPKVEELENFKIGVGKVLDLNQKTKQTTGLNKGDFVLYDYYSAFNNDSKNILTMAENIIMFVTEEEAYKFLKGEL